ncbi:DHHW family protein [Acetanaerobacterium elongatum]|uniref:DHHW protein n=1 Tax=Acetanaerobacterium elongatum TaxID=258515 RepID=A0A1H0EQ63_9FIRM|nr:DHHW family protein [Acetanaerobacterium elongatum]SDN84485.1 DHHW protein [Acetanaerobacterium elongatum]
MVIIMAYIEVKTEETGTKLHFNAVSDRVTLPVCINIAVMTVVVAVVALLALVLPKPVNSEFEGRELSKMPAFSLKAILDGSFEKQFDAHYADTFPYRERMVELAAQYNSLKGFNDDDVSIHGTVPVVTDEPEDNTPSQQPPSSLPAVSDGSSSEESSAPQSSSAVAENPLQELDGEMKSGLFVIGDTAMSLFGTNGKEGQRYAKVITGYQEQFGSDVKIYNLVIPTQSEFNLPDKYKHLSGSQKANIDLIYASLGPTITPIRSAYDALAAHKSEYLYFRTDHHWTPLAAYYAYTGFCKDVGLTPVPLEKMTKGRKENFVGSLYRTTQEPKLKAHPDYMDYYLIPYETTCELYRRGARNTPLQTSLYAMKAGGSNTYSMFLSGDWPLFVIHSNAGTGRKIAVVKESFGNAFAPYLASHYDTVYVVDQRYFEKDFDQFVKDNGIKEVLFINNSFAANTTVQINWIKNLNYEKPWVKAAVSSSSSEAPSSSQPADAVFNLEDWFK